MYLAVTFIIVFGIAMIFYFCSSIPIALIRGYGSEAHVLYANSGWVQGGRKTEKVNQMARTWFDH